VPLFLLRSQNGSSSFLQMKEIESWIPLQGQAPASPQHNGYPAVDMASRFSTTIATSRELD